MGLVFSSDFFVNCYMVIRIWEFEDSLGRKEVESMVHGTKDGCVL